MRSEAAELVPSCARIGLSWTAACCHALLAWGCSNATHAGSAPRGDELPQESAVPGQAIESAAGLDELASAAPDVAARDDCRVVQADVNGGNGCAVTTAGSVYCWGSAALAALGRAHARDRCVVGAGDSRREVPCSLTPVRVPGIDDALEVSLGAATCVRTRGGLVRCWGNNQQHALGTEVDELCDNPFATTPEHAARVPCSTDPVLVDDLEGAVELQAWGQTCARIANGEVKCWGYHHPSATKVPGVTAALSASASCALLDGGEVRCWGSAESGRLGTSQPLQPCSGPYNQPCTLTAVPVELQVRARNVGSGWQHACAVSEDGRVYCWGHNGYGQLGIGRDSARCASGFPCETLPREVPQLNDVTVVRAGIGSTCALGADGHARCWGNLPIAGLRGATPHERIVPLPGKVIGMSAERSGVCFVLEDGALYCASLRYELEGGVGVLGPGWSLQRVPICSQDPRDLE
jgi:hypothetical protein